MFRVRKQQWLVENVGITRHQQLGSRSQVNKTDGTYCRTSSNAPAKVTAKLKERMEREKREVEFI